MQVVEYSASENLSRGIMSRRNVGSVRIHEEGVAEINRLLADRPVRGYNEEEDYYWGRKRSPALEPRRILRVEA